MTDDELRAMIRESIARHVGIERGGRHQPDEANVRLNPDATIANVTLKPDATTIAFAKFALAKPADDDGMCIIEPAVRCTHCGYCQSYGH